MENSFSSNRRYRKEGQDVFTIIMAMASILNNKEIFLNTLYNAINMHPSYIILSDMPRERKLEIITELISYYEKREDYEKCAKMLKIKKDVDIC